ncbi:hypothetical protein SAMD00023378_4181 [Ralstonia sp. NT80]|nr:hypothetical protein SAMD00023378_4181 [Ralstonia sp. NT80]
MECNAHGFRHARAGTFPCIGINLQAVVDMQSDKAHTHARIAPRGTRMQQRGRIPPAR